MRSAGVSVVIMHYFKVFFIFGTFSVSPILEIRDKEYRDKSLENREGVCARAVYGRYQNVFLSNTELSELQADFPTVWQEYIERLSEYMASTGRTYKSHAATIRRWIADDRRKATPPARDRDYSVKDGDTV